MWKTMNRMGWQYGMVVGGMDIITQFSLFCLRLFCLHLNLAPAIKFNSFVWFVCTEESRHHRNNKLKILQFFPYSRYYSEFHPCTGYSGTGLSVKKDQQGVLFNIHFANSKQTNWLQFPAGEAYPALARGNELSRGQTYVPLQSEFVSFAMCFKRFSVRMKNAAGCM